VTVFLLLVLSSLSKGHNLGINKHQTSTNKQQVLVVPKIQLQDYVEQAIYTGLNLLLLLLVDDDNTGLNKS
jgi:hypothetical protein